MDTPRDVTILLVEDDAGHARLIQKNLRRAHLSNDIVVATDGQRALDLLLGTDGQLGMTPLLILLDLNLPVLDGYQVLERIKRDAHLAHIPVIVLTTTDDEREVARCYELGCNVYLTKPIEYQAFSDAIRRLGLFLSVVALPERVPQP